MIPEGKIFIMLPLSEVGDGDYSATCDANCPTCGRNVESRDYAKTMVGFDLVAGHNHDDNCRKFRFACECGTRFRVNPVVKCPSCDWFGKTECAVPCSPMGVVYAIQNKEGE